MKPKTLQSQLVVNDVISVRKERLLHHNQHEEDYYIVSAAPESVSIVAISYDGKILVTREYRHAIGGYVTGFAGGSIDEGESPLDAAKRELLEETGCTAANFEILGSCYPLPGILTQKMTIVLARGVTQQHPAKPQASEVIESRFITLLELHSLVQQGDCIDGIMCTALHFYNLSNCCL